MKRGRVFCTLMLEVSMGSLLFLAGCVPTRGRPLIRTTSGKDAVLAAQAPSLGQSTREDVEARYHAFAVDSGVPNLYWARFIESRWLVAGMYGATRVWNAHNILVRFDETGLVRTEEEVPDHDLAARFASMQKAEGFPPLDLSTPLQVLVTTAETVEISGNELIFHQAAIPMYRGNKKKGVRPARIVRIAIAQIADIQFEETLDHLSAERPCVQGDCMMRLHLKFAGKTELGEDYRFSAEPRAALTLVRWMQPGATRKD